MTLFKKYIFYSFQQSLTPKVADNLLFFLFLSHTIFTHVHNMKILKNPMLWFLKEKIYIYMFSLFLSRNHVQNKKVSTTDMKCVQGWSIHMEDMLHTDLRSVINILEEYREFDYLVQIFDVWSQCIMYKIFLHTYKGDVL